MSLHKRLLALAVVAVTVVSVMLAGNVLATVPTTTSTYYLHGTTSLTLNTTAPTGATANYKDAPAINRTAYKDVGTWQGPAATQTMLFRSISPLTVWLGLVNSDDQGTWFDVQAQLLLNGTTIVATGSKTNIQNVTRDASKALQVSVPLTLISNPPMLNVGDTLKLKITARVTAIGGHNSAVGLRVYYDANTRAANFGLTTQAAIMDLQVRATNPTTATFSIGNIKPTDSGNAANWLVKNVGSLDGTLSILIGTITNNENGITEPEASAGDTTASVGELGAKLKVAFWMDADKGGGWSAGPGRPGSCPSRGG